MHIIMADDCHYNDADDKNESDDVMMTAIVMRSIMTMMTNVMLLLIMVMRKIV